MGILVLISWLCANLLCHARATGVEAGALAHFQRLTAAGAGSGGELRGRTLLPVPAELQMEEQEGDPGRGSPQPALASPPASTSAAPPGSCQPPCLQPGRAKPGWDISPQKAAELVFSAGKAWKVLPRGQRTHDTSGQHLPAQHRAPLTRFPPAAAALAPRFSSPRVAVAARTPFCIAGGGRDGYR